MKRFLILCLFMCGVVFTAPQMANAQESTIVFKNQNTFEISVAVGYKDAVRNTAVVIGWWVVKPKGELDLSFNVGSELFYIYGDSENYTFEGDKNNPDDGDAKVVDDAFEYIDGKEPKNGYSVRFKGIKLNVGGVTPFTFNDVTKQ